MEFNTAVVAATAAGVCVTAPWAVALAPSVSYVTAAGFGVLAAVRFRQGMKIIRYRRNLRRLPRYVMSTVSGAGISLDTEAHPAPSGHAATGGCALSSAGQSVPDSALA